jgi:hypothetical protein
MTVARRLFAGAAVQTTLVSPISATDLTIAITGDVGWPTGAQEFFVVIEPDQSNEEKVLVTRSGTTLTAASTAKRGVDGTSASSHPAGAVIYPCVSATDLDDANRAASRLTSGSTGQVAVASANAAGFDFVTFGLDNLDDVDASAPSDGDILQYDNVTGDWSLAQIPAPSISTLTDVDLTSVSDGDIIQFDSGSGDWVNVPLIVSPVVGFAVAEDTRAISTSTLVNLVDIDYAASSATNLLVFEVSFLGQAVGDGVTSQINRRFKTSLENTTDSVVLFQANAGRVLTAASTAEAQIQLPTYFRIVVTAGSTATKNYQVAVTVDLAPLVNVFGNIVPSTITITEIQP